jgi:hypothetical protein
MGLLTGHCHFRRHLFKLGKVNTPICRKCCLEAETASYILCDCDGIAETQFHYLGRNILKTGNYHEILPRKIVCFIVGIELLAV